MIKYNLFLYVDGIVLSRTIRLNDLRLGMVFFPPVTIWFPRHVVEARGNAVVRRKTLTERRNGLYQTCTYTM